MEQLLRPWSPADRDELVQLVNSVDRTYLSSRLPDPFTAADADAWLKNAGEREGRRGIYRAILLGGAVVGCLYAEMQDFPEAARDANLSCFLRPDACGRRLGSRALTEVTRLAFDQLEVARLTAYVCGPNLPSRKMLSANGYRLEGQLRQAVSHGEDLWDLCIYGKLRGEV